MDVAFSLTHLSSMQLCPMKRHTSLLFPNLSPCSYSYSESGWLAALFSANCIQTYDEALFWSEMAPGRPRVQALRWNQGSAGVKHCKCHLRTKAMTMDITECGLIWKTVSWFSNPELLTTYCTHTSLHVGRRWMEFYGQRYALHLE